MELLELILEDNNLNKAIARVIYNSGSGGVDKMSVDEGSKYFKEHKENIKESLKKRTYKPTPIELIKKMAYTRNSYAKPGENNLGTVIPNKRILY